MADTPSPRSSPTSGRSGAPVVGILGGGQLARMTAMAAARLGVRTRVYSDTRGGAVEEVCQIIEGAYDDEAELARFAEMCDVVTLDNEWTPLDTLVAVAPNMAVWPAPSTMTLVRDKVSQKKHAQARGIPLGAFVEACSEPEALDAASTFGWPVVLKRPVGSYDGYGNRVVGDAQALADGWQALSGDDNRVLVERFVPFEMELAVMVARRPGGEDCAYPVAHTRQVDQRTESVVVPADVPAEVQERATALARQVASAFGCVGVVGVEMFLLADGSLLFNELAPRPHNSGHYTIDACRTSQFENHVRAVLDLPLGDASLAAPFAAMVNLIATAQTHTSWSSTRKVLTAPGVAVHDYAKRDARVGRKMGHVTATGVDRAEVLERARAAAKEFV